MNLVLPVHLIAACFPGKVVPEASIKLLGQQSAFRSYTRAGGKVVRLIEAPQNIGLF